MKVLKVLLAQKGAGSPMSQMHIKHSRQMNGDAFIFSVY